MILNGGQFPWEPLTRLYETWERTPNKRRFRILIYTLLFLTVFFCAFSPFLLGGKTFVWYLDARDQIYPYMIYTGKYLRTLLSHFLHGDFSVPLFDLSMGWGDDVIGYLSSNWMTDPLVLLFSLFAFPGISESVYALLSIFRLYLAGLSFLYLCRHFQKPTVHALIGALIYCFCGYGIYSVMAIPNFVTPMIQLPLLIVGIDKILQKKGSRLFILTVLYSALCGFYHLYMMTIMVVFYALVRLFDLYPKGGRRKAFPGLFLRGAGAYCLGIGLSAPLFFPCVAEFLAGERNGFSNLQISSYPIVHWIYLWWRFLRFAAPTDFVEYEWGMNWPAFAAIALFAVVLLFLSKRKRTLKWMVGAALIALFSPLGGWIMNGFQYSSNRWAFGLALAVAYAVTEMLPALLQMTFRRTVICWAVLCFYAFVSVISPMMRRVSYAAFGIAFLALTLLVLTARYPALSARTPQKLKGRLRSLACLVLVTVNVCVYSLYDCAEDQGGYARQFARSGMEWLRIAASMESSASAILDKLETVDGRFDSDLFAYNLSMVWNVPEIIFYSATTSGNATRLWREMEGAENLQVFKVYSSDQRTIFNTLLSGKYHLETESHQAYVPYAYTLAETSEAGDRLYINDYALPWGYTYERSVSYDSLEGMNGVEKQEALLQAVALDKRYASDSAQALRLDSRKLPYTFECENCEWENGLLNVSDENAVISLSADLPGGVEYYVRLKGFDIDGYGNGFLSGATAATFNISVKCGDVSKTSRAQAKEYQWYYGRENYLFCLGCAEQARDAVHIMIPEKGAFKLNDIELYALPMDHYAERAESLRAEPLENIEMGVNQISGTVDLSQDKILCLSVPYSKGWSAYVDGQKTEILLANYAFMGLPLSAGPHEIVFTYCSPGLKAGAAISVASLGIVLALAFCRRRRGMRLLSPQERE